MVRNPLSLAVLAGAVGVSASIVSLPQPLIEASQRLLSSVGAVESDFKCDLPPVLAPKSDNLPSAADLFSSKAALAKQVERHQAVVRVPSISYDDLGSFEQDKRWKPFTKLHKVLAETYPTLYKRAKVEKVNKFGLVFTVEGSDPSLKPILLAAHQDVVPVGDPSAWKYPPFDAHYDGTYIWGRGASDDKASLTAILSALETLLNNEAFEPTRTIILASGFDEECSGYRGALMINNFLLERYGKDSMAVILDEGGLGIQDIGGVQYALPAVMEKGHVDIWLELHVVGGHSSAPFPHTGIGIISEIVEALEAHPYDTKLTKESPVYSQLVCQARYSPDAQPKLTESIRKGDLDSAAAEFVKLHRLARFLISTSQAVDMISGGQKINAMPEIVKLGVNYRVSQFDDIPLVQHNVIEHVKDISAKYGLAIKAYEGDDAYEAYLAKVAPEELVSTAQDIDYQGTLIATAQEPSDHTPISPTTGAVWDIFSGTIQHTFGGDGKKIVPVGSIMTGNTDTRHYLKLSRHIYRWSPGTSGSTNNIHTTDERINMEDHMGMVKFYYDFIRNFQSLQE